MSWLFSRALVAEYSEESCSGGEPSAPSNSTPTPQAYWSPGKTTDACPRFRSGMTCEHLTADRGAELLASFRADFPARTYQLPEKERASTESVADCGASLRESLAKYDHDSCSWKTRQRLLGEDSTESLVIFPRWGSMRNGVLYQRQTPALPICESACSLRLPTLTLIACEHPGRIVKKPRQQTCTSMALAQRDMWQRGGRYSPSHAAWFMGFPISWTNLGHMATHRSRQWLRSHGESCINDLPE